MTVHLSQLTTTFAHPTGSLELFTTRPGPSWYVAIHSVHNSSTLMNLELALMNSTWYRVHSVINTRLVCGVCLPLYVRPWGGRTRRTTCSDELEATYPKWFVVASCPACGAVPQGREPECLCHTGTEYEQEYWLGPGPTG